MTNDTPENTQPAKPKRARKPRPTSAVEVEAAFAAATEDTPKQPEPAAKVEPDARALVEQVAAATKLEGLSVEARQNGKRHVIVLTDADGARVLSYVDPLVRGKGFRLHVQDYGSERRLSTETVAKAAAAVKTSARIKPKPAATAKKKTTAATQQEAAA
jgi:hypothetical protein